MKKKLLLLISLILVVPQVFSEEPKIKIQIETSVMKLELTDVILNNQNPMKIDFYTIIKRKKE